MCIMSRVTYKVAADIICRINICTRSAAVDDSWKTISIYIYKLCSRHAAYTKSNFHY